VNLTADQIKARSALVDDFRARIVAAFWEAIEHADPALLCSDDGTSYGDMRQASTGYSSLDQMVNECTGKAVAHLRNWL
jgi:hypothetical protein